MADKKSDFEVHGSAKLLNDEKSKKADEQLKKLRESEKADMQKAKTSRSKAESVDKAASAARKKEKAVSEAAHKKAEAELKKAEKKIAAREKEITNVAMAAGTALFAGITKSDDRRQRKVLIMVLVAVVVVGAIGFIFFKPQLAGLLGLSLPSISVPDTLSGFLPDESMGYNKIDFENAILGKAHEKQELIVMEQDVQVDNELSSALGNISLFKKTKLVHSFGTGVYTVGMGGMDSKHIKVSEDSRTVTVTVPHTVLQYVNVDLGKTQFEETEKAILGFGDIKLTQEQQKILSDSVYNEMFDKLNDKELYSKADEIALLQIREMFQPLVSAVSEQFLVKVEFDSTSKNKPVCSRIEEPATSKAA